MRGMGERKRKKKKKKKKITNNIVIFGENSMQYTSKDENENNSRRWSS